MTREWQYDSDDVARFASQHPTAIADAAMARRIAADHPAIDPADWLMRTGTYGRTVSTDSGEWEWDDVTGDAVATVVPNVRYAVTGGRPANWVTTVPSADVAEQSTVKVSRGKKGTTRKVTRHGRTMVTYEGTRMTTSELAAVATETVRLACSLCRAVRDACQDHEADDRACRSCVKGCGCMPDVLGADRVAYAQIVHAGPGAHCPVAQGSASILAAYGDILATLDSDERAAARDAYVNQTASETSESVGSKGKAHDVKLSWPVRYSPDAAWSVWRASERESFTLSQPIVDYWREDMTAAIIDRVTLLPSHDDRGGRFVGHRHHDERGAKASRQPNAKRDHGRALARGALANEVAANVIEVGESTIVDDVVRIDRLAATTYRVDGTDKRTRTLTAALKLAHQVAAERVVHVPTT
jgi:hypothetical protein